MKANRLACTFMGVLALGAVLYASEPSARPSGEIYVGGHVARPGAYSITGRPTDVLNAIDQAGVEDPNSDYEVRITHIVASKGLERFTKFNSLKALREVPEESFTLRPDDQVSLHPIKR